MPSRRVDYSIALYAIGRNLIIAVTTTCTWNVLNVVLTVSSEQIAVEIIVQQLI
jgi:hypothetical protein